MTGDGPILGAYGSSSKDSIDSTTWITILLVVVILLVIYRSPVSPMIPLITIALAYLISRGVVALLGAHALTISMYTNVFLIVVLFGAGTDYCLFLISRFREEMADVSSPAPGRQDHGALSGRDHCLQRRHGDRGPGYDDRGRTGPLQYQRTQHRHRSGHRPPCRSDPDPGDADHPGRSRLLAAQSPTHEGSRSLARVGGQSGEKTDRGPARSRYRAGAARGLRCRAGPGFRPAGRPSRRQSSPSGLRRARRPPGPRRHAASQCGGGGSRRLRHSTRTGGDEGVRVHARLPASRQHRSQLHEIAARPEDLERRRPTRTSDAGCARRDS